MADPNDPYGDGIPESHLWDVENNRYMQRSLFPGRWIPMRISPWDVDRPACRFDPNKDRTYQEAVLKRPFSAVPQVELPAAAEVPDAPRSEPEPRPNPTLSARFDGRWFTIRSEQKEGIYQERYAAVSGQPDREGAFDYSRERQRMYNKGPIPAGNYWINPQQIIENPNVGNAMDVVNKISGILPRGIKKGRFPGGSTSWGRGRVDIYPKQIEAGGVQRGDFTIHGGTTPGSRGCIDLMNNETSFFDFLKKHRGDQDSVPLIVDYPEK